MLHVVVNKVEIYFGKIGFADSKWSNLNAHTSLNTIYFLRPIWGALRGDQKIQILRSRSRSGHKIPDFLN